MVKFIIKHAVIWKMSFTFTLFHTQTFHADIKKSGMHYQMFCWLLSAFSYSIHKYRKRTQESQVCSMGAFPCTDPYKQGRRNGRKLGQFQGPLCDTGPKNVEHYCSDHGAHGATSLPTKVICLCDLQLSYNKNTSLLLYHLRGKHLPVLKRNDKPSGMESLPI